MGAGRVSQLAAFGGRQLLAAEVNFVLNAGISLTALCYVLITQDLGDWRATLLLVGLALSAVAHGAAVLLVRRAFWRLWVLHGALCAQVVAIVGAIAVSGGPTLTAANQLLTLCPAIAWLVAGARVGCIWLGVVFGVELLVLALNLVPGFYLNLRHAHDQAADHMLVWTYMLLMVSGIVWGMSSQRDGEARDCQGS